MPTNEIENEITNKISEERPENITNEKFNSIQDLVDNFQSNSNNEIDYSVDNVEELSLEDLEQLANSEESSTLKESTQQIMSLFPQKLESSGYVILSSVALIFALFFLLQAMLFRKLLVSIQDGHKTLKDMSFSLYIQQQLTEYRLLLADLNYSITPVEKANARTQLYNHLNTICLEICETRDKKLAIQLAQIFFSKIQSRYLKLVSIPEGLVYFKYVSQHLIANPYSSPEESVQHIRKNYKKDSPQDMQKEVITKVSPIEKRSKFPFSRKN